MYHEDIFCPFLPMFSTFDGKMVNVVENAECFSIYLYLYFVQLLHIMPLIVSYEVGFMTK